MRDFDFISFSLIMIVFLHIYINEYILLSTNIIMTFDMGWTVFPIDGAWQVSDTKFQKD